MSNKILVDRFEFPLNEGAVELRIDLENIQIVRVDWRRGYVELKVCGVTWFDHRPAVVKAAQRYLSHLANWQASAEKNYYGTELADPVIDADFSDAQKNLRIVEARYDQSEQEFTRLFEFNRSDSPVADLTIKHRGGQIYVVAKPTANEAEQFINRIWSNDSRRVIGFAIDGLYSGTGFGNYLVVTPEGLDIGAIYPSDGEDD